MELPIIRDLLVIFSLSAGIMILCSWIRIPAIIGFLVTGVIAGPSGLGLVSAVHEVQLLAEIGVIFLLFTIGIEFSFKRLLKIKKAVFGGGLTQMVLTAVLVALLAIAMTRPVKEAVFIGLLVALSSTAIVLKLFQEKGEINTPHGHTALAILIFQDLAVVPILLLTPIISGAEGASSENPFMVALKAALIILLAFAMAKWIMPWILHKVAQTRNKEVFLMSVMVTCFAVAWGTNQLGLSLALGAFLAGLIISESDYSEHALGDILPFRDLFASLFFVSVGMLIDMSFVAENITVVVPVTMAVLFIKIFTGSCGAAFSGISLRAALIVGFAISQVGEFAFILAKSGMDFGLMNGDDYQLFLAVSGITMVATPLLIAMSSKVADFMAAKGMPERFGKPAGHHPGHVQHEQVSGHLVIIGYGVNGRNISRAARAAAIPYVIVETNAETVRREKANGERIVFGDATYEGVLRHAGGHLAKVVVVAVSDPVATKRIVGVARKLNPKAHIIVRTRLVNEVAELCTIGADEVVPEEFETSISIFTRVMARFMVDRADIARMVAEIRADGYGILRGDAKSCACKGAETIYSDIEVSTMRIDPASEFAGRTLADIGMGKNHSVSVFAIQRGKDIIPSPSADTMLQAGDRIMVIGSPVSVGRVAPRCTAENPKS